MSELPDAKQSRADAAFHAHLDECGQCRDQPMQLCVRGRALLVRTADFATPAKEHVQQQYRNYAMHLHFFGGAPHAGGPDGQ